MIPAVRKRLTYSNVIASLALFVALGGVAVAAGLPKNSVGPNQIKRGAVTAAKIRKQAVTSAKLAPQSVINGKLAANSVGPGNIGNGAVTTAKIGKAAVIAESIKNSVVTTNKLNNEAVTTPKLGKEAVATAKLDNEAVTTGKLGKESVTAAKLSKEVGPLLGTLKSGQTLQGMFNLGDEGGDTVQTGQTFQFPLANTPTAHVIDPATATTASCPGLGANNQAPQAAAGQLCIYVTNKPNLGTLSVPSAAQTRLGFGLEAIASGAGAFSATGLWAVTAP